MTSRGKNDDRSRLVLSEVDTGQQVVQYVPNERKSSVLEFLSALEYFCHILDVLGVVAVQFRQRLFVMVSRHRHVFPTFRNLFL